MVLKRQPSSRKLSLSLSPQRKKIVPVVDDEPVVPMAPRRKLEFSKYNFDVQRPPLKLLHSLPDFFAGTTPTANKPRYSRQYRDKQLAEVPRLDAFAKLSYTDLLAQFCFSGGALAPASALAPKLATNTPTGSPSSSSATSATSANSANSAAGAIKAPTPIKAVSPPHPHNHTTTSTTSIDHPPLPRKLAPCRPLTAATLHALGDEIHI